MAITAVLRAVGQRLYHGLQFKVIGTGFAPGVQEGDLVTYEQVVTSSTSNLFIQNTEFPAHTTATVPQGYNAIAYGTYTVNGTLTVDGEFRVVDWPV